MRRVRTVREVRNYLDAYELRCARRSRELAAQGIAAILSSTTGPVAAPFGGSRTVLGTNPLTVSLPSAGPHPLVADLATTAGAYGKIVAARNEGTDIPDDWGVDATARPTTDPAAVLDGGALLPFGGHKGSGLAILLELLAGPLAGGNMAAETTDMWVDPSVRMGTGHLLWVVDPVGLHGDDAAIGRAAGFQRRLREAAPAQGVSEVLSPGDVDEAVRFLLKYGVSGDVFPNVHATGFELLRAFRDGFLQGGSACDVGI